MGDGIHKDYNSPELPDMKLSHKRDKEGNILKPSHWSKQDQSCTSCPVSAIPSNRRKSCTAFLDPAGRTLRQHQVLSGFRAS